MLAAGNKKEVLAARESLTLRLLLESLFLEYVEARDTYACKLQLKKLVGFKLVRHQSGTSSSFIENKLVLATL